ncbi:unnamed protein product [Parnassius mnemosyne]|uniref:Uncharacterized protein n=1 Tax=Parnassius mnemosyne TaxID=213953 RepID=A0AAV1LSE9_9NEOP
MKSVIIFALFVAAAVAVPIDSRDATIVRSNLDNIGVGDYSYGYETSDGKVASAEGHLKSNGPENQFFEVRGSYSYPAPDGVVYTVTYVADENGFRADGAHIPRS